MRRGVTLLGRGRRAFSAEAQLKTTALYNFHQDNGAKMVPFCGWSMPVQYKDSIIDSTNWCRENASIFDVSHMCQLRFHGEDRTAFIDKLICGSIKALKPNQTRYSLMLNENGGAIDDLVVTNRPDHIYMVVNAGRTDEDLEHIGKEMEKFKADNPDSDLYMEWIRDRELIALQGPEAVKVLKNLATTDVDVEDLGFFYMTDGEVAGVPGCQVSRSGYTGEDGFEISIPREGCETVVNAFLENPLSRLAGLGARDALRLEVGLCLYGHDLDESVTPVEADLMWTISKVRREKGKYIGADVVRKQLAEGVKRIRTGFAVTKGAPVREGYDIVNDADEVIGVINSGTFSPALKKGIAMGFVPPEYSEVGTKLRVKVRKKFSDVEVVSIPFVKKGY